MCLRTEKIENGVDHCGVAAQPNNLRRTGIHDRRLVAIGIGVERSIPLEFLLNERSDRQNAVYAQIHHTALFLLLPDQIIIAV